MKPKYKKRSKQLAALLFMERVSNRLHKQIPSHVYREWSPEYKAWSIAMGVVRDLTQELGGDSYYEIRWGILGD